MLGTTHPTKNNIPEEQNLHFFFFYLNLNTVKNIYNCTLLSQNIYEFWFLRVSRHNTNNYSPLGYSSVWFGSWLPSSRQKINLQYDYFHGSYTTVCA